MKHASAAEITELDITRLIEEHQAGVWRYLRALGCEASQAEDITQETFIKVLEKPFEQINRSATASYLRRIAHNLFISIQRREGRVTFVHDFQGFEEVWDHWASNDDGEELLAALKECLQQLTERARWALEMRYREKRSRAGIAEALEITEHGAKNLMQRAKKQLRECVESKHKEE